MSELRTQHQNAMALLERAVVVRAMSGEAKAQDLFREALNSELKAVEIARKEAVPEPTFSILHRSAASIALSCSEYRTAEKIILQALLVEPPPVLEEELRDLLETVYFDRHMNLRGVALSADELQLSVAGKAVGFGLALSDLFVERIEHTSKLLYRTVERRLNRPFRETGTIAKAIKQVCQVYMSVPRPASFAVSLRLGQPTVQTYDPEIVGVTEIIDDVLDCLGMVNDGKNTELRDRIANDAYYNNFVGLIKLIAPDGENLNLVGFTSLRHGQERHVALTRPSDKIDLAPRSTYVNFDGERVTIRGRLLFADAWKSKQIKIVDVDGKQHAIDVPVGMMADVVKPLWESDALAVARHTPDGLMLEDISKVAAEDVTDFRLYYVNLGDGADRSWEDNQEYGFICAGFDPKYSRQLSRLHVGDRVFAYLKGKGFVGYGVVLGNSVPAKDFTLPSGQKLWEVPLHNEGVLHDLNDVERSEWIVPIEWLRTFSRDEAKTFPGIFTNENIACRLNDLATIEFLKREFGVDEGT
jgi:hypothetical protein